MTYEEIISWISKKYEESGYDIYNLDDVARARQQLIRDYDTDGRLRHFLEGNPHMTKYMIDSGRARWGGIEGTSVESDFFREIEEPIIDELNRNIEDQLTGEIESADTTDEIGEIDVPNNLMPDVIERLEETKNNRFSELRGDEIKTEIGSPTTEVSRLNQLLREVRKLPDESARKDLQKEIKGETRRLSDLNQFFLEGIREENTLDGLNDWVSQINNSDLRDKQKQALQRIAEARRESGFPEVSEV